MDTDYLNLQFELQEYLNKRYKFLIKEIRENGNLNCHYIKNIDESPYTKDQLVKFIISNPHLHNVIKTNLLNNLH